MSNRKLKCIILDDEMPSLKFLKILLGQLEGIEIVKVFNDPLMLVKEYRELEFDFCILDVEMPQLTGFDIAEILRDYPIIFATAYKQYASEAFDINAVDYITKPISLQRLKQAVEKVKSRFSKKGADLTYAQFNTDKGKALIHFDKILFIRNSDVDSRDKILFFEDETDVTVKNISFGGLLTVLPDSDFVRINKREIISLRIVKFFNSEEIVTTLKDQLDKPMVLGLRETYRKSFMELLTGG
ncbi:LytR/AlgR family response regulator transcription factor [Sphingobacterium yanglingense]|uniref:DNA-binding LytR/AlgR family response regulator n=1 Tax=Sphingobacterium yanglingense TaxID=1437280 RepID=A0A4R6WMD6_9SPHI|nr:response regulator transcription factor [Sphingobacterium yanglingense]TDQ79952.1 DNA-binding LytR/AlgR family response regulator [Sphingobacterium yanglingense]